jgi:cystathionine beta-lyase family protein involved in aluminum resistance
MHAGVTRVCHIQRSCGYCLRPTFTVAEIREAIGIIRSVDSTITVSVDNCYGEFTEPEEPGAAGADLVMGSLIKNPGGTIVTGEHVLFGGMPGIMNGDIAP